MLANSDEPNPRDRRRDCLAFDVLDLLQSEPALSQRKIAERLDMSLGRVNYFLKMFSKEQWIERVGSHGNGSHHVESYLLTDQGLAARSALGLRILPIKLSEFSRLRKQIERLSGSPAPDDTHY